ncbi:hypothetical protein NUW58_g9561 [Xylaria curta]|uniref:Uncharacterized protein n=1 Tax=Xylaria curta TaxID=42375 RepID=A0ACC1MXC4_9PEZI|nr:hypothetical protein NUW58_g9561 [Xylaria curta]
MSDRRAMGQKRSEKWFRGVELAGDRKPGVMRWPMAWRQGFSLQGPAPSRSPSGFASPPPEPRSALRDIPPCCIWCTVLHVVPVPKEVPISAYPVIESVRYVVGKVYYVGPVPNEYSSGPSLFSLGLLHLKTDAARGNLPSIGYTMPTVQPGFLEPEFSPKCTTLFTAKKRPMSRDGESREGTTHDEHVPLRCHPAGAVYGVSRLCVTCFVKLMQAARQLARASSAHEATGSSVVGGIAYIRQPSLISWKNWDPKAPVTEQYGEKLAEESTLSLHQLQADQEDELSDQRASPPKCKALQVLG